jgi:hypothetical protein
MHVPPTARLRRPLALLAAVLLAASVGVAGCGGVSDGGRDLNRAGGQAAKEDSAGRDEAADGTERNRPGDSAARKPPKLAQSHVIRTAMLTLQVKDVPTALEQARSAAENAGGYVGDEATDRDAGGHERSRIVLRVPQEEYDGVLSGLSDAGKLIERKVNAKDVTDQVVDVGSRIKSQEASIARVRELMEKATELTDVVTLEGELDTRQAELEALKAQQQSLEERTSMSTITLVLAETEVKREQKDDETSFTEALAGGWNAFVTTVHWIAVVLGAILPFAVTLALLIVIWRVVRGRMPERADRTSRTRDVTPPPPVTIPAPVTSPEGAAERTSRPAEEGRREE